MKVDKAIEAYREAVKRGYSVDIGFYDAIRALAEENDAPHRDPLSGAGRTFDQGTLKERARLEYVDGLNRALHDATERAEVAESQLSEWRDSASHAAEETCADSNDQRHCACVGALRSLLVEERAKTQRQATQTWAALDRNVHLLRDLDVLRAENARLRETNLGDGPPRCRATLHSSPVSDWRCEGATGHSGPHGFKMVWVRDTP